MVQTASDFTELLDQVLHETRAGKRRFLLLGLQQKKKGDQTSCFSPSSGTSPLFPRCRTWHFPFLNFTRILLIHFSSQSPFEWQDTHKMYHLLLLVLCHLQRVQSVSSSGPLMKTLQSINSRVTPQVTDLNLELTPLITTLWVQQLSQFSIHPTVHWFYTYFTSFSTRMLWETVLKANVDNLHCSPFLHQVTHDLIIGRQNLHFVNQSSLLPAPCSPSYIWKSFTTSLPQGLRWDWLPCTFLDSPFCLSWRKKWHLLFFPVPENLPRSLAPFRD